MKTSSAFTVPGLRPRAELDARRRDEMFALLSRHFDGVTREQFERDLAEKDWVIEIESHGRLVGFSTLLVREDEFEGRALTAIYSGDTIVDPEGWKSPLLARTWIHAVNALRQEWPERRCFWLLLTSGFRTYRFLPVFWREFHPRLDARTPPATQRLLERLAGAQYGALYEPSSGLVRFPHPQRLRGALQAVPAGRTADPHVAFFLTRNPGHAEGDELACLTEISDGNLTPAGRRMVDAPPR
jgi:hypothetical protein